MTLLEESSAWEKGAPAPERGETRSDLGSEGTRRACALDARFGGREETKSKARTKARPASEVA